MGNSRPIGIFDSGVGGLTVVNALLKRLPGESFIYFGDTAHVPYGTKTREQLFQYAEDIIEFFLKKNVKAIVVACGTHSSVTLPVIQETCPVPILGVVKPGSLAAVKASKGGRVGVIATQATVNSGAYRRNIQVINPDYQVFQAACTRFVPLVEQGMMNSNEAREAASEYISPLLEEGIDTLVMGCTHYPFLAPLLKELVGPEVCLLDPATETIEELAWILEKKELINDEKVSAREFWVSGDADSFRRVGRLLLGDVIDKVGHITLD